MFKTLCLVILLVGTVALTGRNLAATSAASFGSPQIVAQGRLVNQTAPFSHTILTPTEDGLYRLSAYATITTADANSTSNWIYGFNWTDPTEKVQNVGLLGANDYQLGQFTDYALWSTGNPITSGGVTRTFQVTKGTPITQTMSLSGPSDNSAYSLYYTLERLN
jgi:hypothetical protein